MGGGRSSCTSSSRLLKCRRPRVVSGGRGCCCGCARRHVIVGLLMLCAAINYADRVNISIAVVDMASTYGWDMQTRAAVLSSFFWGYLCSQVLGALLAQRYGGVVVLGWATFFWSVFTCATPLAAVSRPRPNAPDLDALRRLILTDGDDLVCRIAGGRSWATVGVPSAHGRGRGFPHSSEHAHHRRLGASARAWSRDHGS
jgi:hypothetical protein